MNGENVEVVELIGQHAVDLGGLEAGVGHRVAHRDRGERARALVRAAGVVGFADADDRILVAQEFRRGGIDIVPRQRHILDSSALSLCRP